jgi:hypothetical protein
MNEELMTSGSVNFNIIRMVVDHTPIRMDEIVGEIHILRKRIADLEDEYGQLERIMRAVEK